MANFLLHEGAKVICEHPKGEASPNASNARVTVSGKKIVTRFRSQYVISGCLNPLLNLGPCVSAQWIKAAERVKAGGEPVLLTNSQARCLSSGGGLIIMSTQGRVTGA